MASLGCSVGTWMTRTCHRPGIWCCVVGDRPAIDCDGSKHQPAEGHHHELIAMTTGLFAAAALATAQPATAAPSEPTSAEVAVDQLQAQGHRVILNKVGAGSLEDCAVTALRRAAPITELDATGDDNTTEVLYTPIYLTATC